MFFFSLSLFLSLFWIVSILSIHRNELSSSLIYAGIKCAEGSRETKLLSLVIGGFWNCGTMFSNFSRECNSHEVWENCETAISWLASEYYYEILAVYNFPFRIEILRYFLHKVRKIIIRFFSTMWNDEMYSYDMITHYLKIAMIH